MEKRKFIFLQKFRKMKKSHVLLLIAIIFMAASCDKKSKDLEYNGANPMVIALQETANLDIKSDYDVTLTSDDYGNVTIQADGSIYGKNVGTANVTMDNGYNKLTIPVNVNLFHEPTFEFGCNPGRIKELYGEPHTLGYTQNNELYYIYTQKTESGHYTYACGEMDFFFENNSYFESDVYIRNGLDLLLEDYLTENFTPIDTFNIYNPAASDSVQAFFYLNKFDKNVFCGRYPSGNQYNETVLFYSRFTDKTTPSHARQRLVARQRFQAAADE